MDEIFMNSDICAATEGGEGRGHYMDNFGLYGVLNEGRESILLVKWREGKSDRFIKKIYLRFFASFSHRTASNILKLPTYTHKHTHTHTPSNPHPHMQK